MISIIIPVYKAEKYIRRCLDSVLNQTYINWECIIIDDGSPDSSGSICDEYVAMDSRFAVIHKQNGGVSSARNLGIERAKGEKITFLDADDWYKESFLQDLVHSDADVVACGFDCTESKSFPLKAHYYSKDEVFEKMGTIMHESAFWTPWGKLFNAKFIKNFNIRFNQNLRLGEDTCFDWEILSYVETIEYIAPCNYCYEGNPRNLSKYKLSWDEIVELEDALIKHYERIETHVNKEFKKKKAGLLSRLGCACDGINGHSDKEIHQLFNVYFPTYTDKDFVKYCSTDVYIIILSNTFRHNVVKNTSFISYPMSFYLKAGIRCFFVSWALKSKLSKKPLSDVLVFISLAWNSIRLRINGNKLQ